MKLNEINENYINLLKSSLLNELYIENEAKIVLAVHSIIGNLKLEPSSFLGVKERESALIDLLKDKNLQEIL